MNARHMLGTVIPFDPKLSRAHACDVIIARTANALQVVQHMREEGMRIVSVYVSTLQDEPTINCMSDDKPACIVAAYGAKPLNAVRSNAVRMRDVYEWKMNGCCVTWEQERSNG